MEEPYPNSRLVAFCDGVFAIALTLLILDIKVPSSDSIKTTNDLWLSLKQLFPSIFAFLLSFTIVFISWFNHHATLKLINKSSSTFIYANGFLLLTVVIIPFPTALLSEYLLTDHAAPAVVVYAAVNGLEALAWILLCQAALTPIHLTRNEKSTLVVRHNQRNAYVGLAIYIVCTAIAFWFPLAIAILISAIYIGWLIVGLNIKSE
jgi:uncharacterized membrane protein